METFIKIALSDYAIIGYELAAIIALIVVGKIFGKKIKAINNAAAEEKDNQMYSDLDQALGNAKRR